MSDHGLTTAEAAARLGVKKETLYAYVSRGLLTRTVASDGRTSRFEAAEIDRLAHDRRPPADGELRTTIATGLTRVDDEGLWVRGRDLVDLVQAGAGFTAVADLVWDAPPGEPWDLTPGPGQLPPGLDTSLLDALRVITALRSAADPLRHDLSAHSVRAVGRSLVAALCHQLPGPGLPRSQPAPSPSPGLPRGQPAPSPSPGLPRSQPAPSPNRLGDQPGPGPGHGENQPGSPGATPAAILWGRLSGSRPHPLQVRALDSAMALLVDHGLAASTFAARIAASVRADPYSVVGAGLGAMGGTLHGAASAAVHELLSEAEAGGDVAAAAGTARRQLGYFPGFGHTIYRRQDPRYGALMAQLLDAWGPDPRLVTVYRVRDVISRRTDAIPNVDLALGALTWLARMPVDAGEAVFAIARTVGWLAHALEEYQEQPLRFRARERYTGPRPS